MKPHRIVQKENRPRGGPADAHIGAPIPRRITFDNLPENYVIVSPEKKLKCSVKSY